MELARGVNLRSNMGSLDHEEYSSILVHMDLTSLRAQTSYRLIRFHVHTNCPRQRPGQHKKYTVQSLVRSHTP
jgi:hypothetical protein